MKNKLLQSLGQNPPVSSTPPSLDSWPHLRDAFDLAKIAFCETATECTWEVTAECEPRSDGLTTATYSIRLQGAFTRVREAPAETRDDDKARILAMRILAEIEAELFPLVMQAIKAAEVQQRPCAGDAARSNR